jgi:hypothetical protein
VLSRTTQVSLPIAKAPVSILIRFGKTSGRSPVFDDRRVVEKHLEQRFVISFQRDEVCWERIAYEAVEHPARIRPPIHVVAERDGHAVADWTRVEVARNVVDHPVEQVRPAMNVADFLSTTIGCEVVTTDADALTGCALFHQVRHLDIAASMTVSRSLPWFDRNQS